MKIRQRIHLLGTLAFLIMASTSAYAHSDLLSSAPANGEILTRAPKAVELIFKKEMQAVSMNSIVVTDQNGRRVDKNSVSVSEDGKQLRVELEDLTSGTFTVAWRGLSVDDHTIKGTFSFKVELSSEGNTATSAAQQTPATAAAMPMNHQMPMQQSGTDWKQSGVRWLMYLAMMTLFGGFAFRLLVLQPTFEGARNLTDEERVTGLRRGEDSFVALTWLSLAVLGVSVLASLLLQTSTALDVSLGEAMSPTRIYQVLAETSFGRPWLLQAATIVALFVIASFAARQVRSRGSERDGLYKAPKLLWLGLILSAVVFLPMSLTGHARAAAGEYPLAIPSDWLHLVGVGIWVGGLFHMALTLPRSSAHLPGAGRLCLVSRVVPLFSRLAVGATSLIVLTGIYNSWIHVDSFSALWTTPYGRVLSLKIILFVPMVALGGFNTFVLRPRFDRAVELAASGEEHRAVDRSLYRSVRAEAAIGVAVLLLAAILAFLPPARQHEMRMMNEKRIDQISLANK